MNDTENLDKKEWFTPEIKSLKIKDTQGGTSRGFGETAYVDPDTTGSVG